jgi:deazaflavin-dependent oxidoreductase (nitroreductase family)
MLQRVDPHAKHGLLYRALVRFSASPVGNLFSRHIMWKLDPVVQRLTKGRVRLGGPLPTALLETRGAKTGQPRSNAVIYFHDGDRVTLIPSRLGDPRHPGWFYNARANPDVVLGGEPFRAEVIEDEAERARLWALADSVFPVYASYRERAAKTGRTIPILQLIPR